MHTLEVGKLHFQNRYVTLPLLRDGCQTAHFQQITIVSLRVNSCFVWDSGQLLQLSPRLRLLMELHTINWKKATKGTLFKQSCRLSVFCASNECPASPKEVDCYVTSQERPTTEGSRSAQDHEETMMALLYAILTDPSSASKSYHTLTLVSRNSLSLVTTHTERIVMEKMMKLQDHPRNQSELQCRTSQLNV
ncbi:uncharacterized protein LOC135347968 isoform X2 [Halichondria panicea]|uniref:uncharacterized protein LOC135347968 isoform X2 n=1 Tax=Halichondria panicea TaxID=6063 RepID=UPI00312B9187